MERRFDEDQYLDEVYGEEPDGECTADCKYPEIKVRLVGEDGNAFAILGRVSGAMRKAGVSKEERDQFFAEAMSGDYDHLLQTCMKWVNVQ